MEEATAKGEWVMGRFRLMILSCLAACLLPSATRAVIFRLLRDPQDDAAVVREAQEGKQVIAFRREVEAVTGRMLHWKERDFRALFGKPVAPEEREYAMMCTEARVIGLSGLRYADEKLNKDHTDTHLLGTGGRIDVYYGIDGETPVHVHYYLKVDKDFVKLDRIGNLQKRLAWERPRFGDLAKNVEKRWREVVVWEVDPEKEKVQYQGIDSGDFNVKLKALLRWGEKHGYQLQHRPASGEATPRWEWLHEGKLMAEAYHDRGFKGDEGSPCYFLLYRPDGTRLRDEGGWPSLDTVRWYRPDGKTMVRCEHGSMRQQSWRPTTWCWYGKDGKAVRSEWDTNGDGVPDRYRDDEFYKKDPGLPLAVERSWAVHPELIPEEMSIPGQAERRVPLRKIKP
jgi:hypothetical protein